MLTTLLLEHLLETEHSVGQLDNLVIRRMLMDAQNVLLQIEQEHLGLLREVARLRESADLGIRSPLCRICPFCLKKCSTCASMPSPA